MTKHGFIVHVTGGHADFVDEYLFFRFSMLAHDTVMRCNVHIVLSQDKEQSFDEESELASSRLTVKVIFVRVKPYFSVFFIYDTYYYY